MASPPTARLSSRADWTLMGTIHDALRRDLDQLLHTTASRTAVRARWVVFRDQLHLHLAAEQAAMWPLAWGQAHRRTARPGPAGCDGR